MEEKINEPQMNADERECIRAEAVRERKGLRALATQLLPIDNSIGRSLTAAALFSYYICVHLRSSAVS